MFRRPYQRSVHHKLLLWWRMLRISGINHFLYEKLIDCVCMLAVCSVSYVDVCMLATCALYAGALNQMRLHYRCIPGCMLVICAFLDI